MSECLTESEIEKLLDSMTKSGAQELNANQMKQLKKYCRRSDDNIDVVFRKLFHELNKNHSQIRVTTVLIIGELFQRSHRFRQLMAENLYEFFELCLELNPKRKLPKPKSFASKLKQIAIDFIQNWDKQFGEGYEELRSAVIYLKDNRLVDFNERTVRNESQKRREEEEQKRRLNVLKLKIEKSVDQLNEIEAEVKSLLTQINTCFELLMPKLTETSDENNDLDRSADRVRHLNDFSVEILVKPFVEIVENDDTNPIIANLREFHSELSKILDFKLKLLINIMSKGSDLCEAHLKRAIDLKIQIQSVSQKFFELNIIQSKDVKQSEELNDGSDNSSDDFEEVEEKEEDLELLIPEYLRHEYGLQPLDQKPSTSTSTAGEQTTDQISNQSLEGESESGILLQCRALLPSGKLCPRRDRIKCPFHGIIIARHSNGVPIDEEDRQREETMKANAPPDWQNPLLLKELKASIGIDLTVNKRKRKKKYPELQDIKQTENNPRKRLERKVFKKSVRERVVRDLDSIQARNQTHFADQWNYSLQS